MPTKRFRKSNYRSMRRKWGKKNTRKSRKSRKKTHRGGASKSKIDKKIEIDKKIKTEISNILYPPHSGKSSGKSSGNTQSEQLESKLVALRELQIKYRRSHKPTQKDREKYSASLRAIQDAINEFEEYSSDQRKSGIPSEPTHLTHAEIMAQMKKLPKGTTPGAFQSPEEKSVSHQLFSEGAGEDSVLYSTVDQKATQAKAHAMRAATSGPAATTPPGEEMVYTEMGFGPGGTGGHLV
jgi:hypothetical protein